MKAVFNEDALANPYNNHYIPSCYSTKSMYCNECIVRSLCGGAKSWQQGSHH